MAYGRLEVYWPDGKIETYLLDAETVSVGQAEGNSISLDTDSISRYHFSLVHKDGQVTITDLESKNGTFVDGLPLKPNVPDLMGDVEEISVGSLRIIFRQVDDSPTLMIHHAEDETQRIERDDSFVRLELDYTHLKVWPASSSSTELSITNTSKETRAFSIQVSGMPSGWLRLTRPEIELDSGETAYVLLNIKPPRRPNTVPQKYHVNIEVAPADQPSLAVHAFIEVQIMPYSGFGMAVGQQVDDNEPVPVFLHNQGSGTLQLSLSAKDKDNALRFHLPHAPLELQAGQRLRVELSIEAKNAPLTGTAKTYPFVVQVKSLDAAGFVAGAEGLVKLAPRFPIWGLVAAAGIGLSVLIIASLALMGALNRRTPLINTMSLNAQNIAQGDPLEITVDAENIESFSIVVDGTVVQTELPGDRRVFSLDTTTLSGDIRVTVIGHNGSETVQDERMAYVFLPVAIRNFEVDSITLLRYTINTFTIHWEVPNARFVRISGLSSLISNPIRDEATEYAASDSLTVRGIPTDTLQIYLYAEDELGTPIQSSAPLTITLIDPICTAREEIILREGPNVAHQQVTTISMNSQVIVTAQDETNTWVRVQLEGGNSAWGEVRLFNCNQQGFNPVNLQTEHNPPPLPTLEVTPAIAISPSPTRAVGRVTPVPQTPVPNTRAIRLDVFEAKLINSLAAVIDLPFSMF